MATNRAYNFVSALERITELERENNILIKENRRLKAPEARLKRLNMMIEKNLALQLEKAALNATKQSNEETDCT